MKKIRIGNDIHFKWMVTRGGAVESFDGKEVDVELRDQTGRRWPCKWSLNADDGCVDGVFYGHMQQAPGIYSLTLTENRGGKGMATVDRTAAWQLVARQDNACEGGDEGALGVSVELMASEIDVGKTEGVTIGRVAAGVKNGEWLNMRNDASFSCCGGTNTKAPGLSSFAYGYGAVAAGIVSTAFGRGTKTSAPNSLVCGIRNYDISNSIFCIGSGFSIEHLNTEVTIRTSDEKNGYKYFLGVGGYKGQEIEDGMKSLQEVVADLEANKTKKKTKRVKRYVIGRAIRPGSLEDTGHENWYCYKDNFDSRVDIPVYVGYRKGSVEHLYVDGEEIDFEGQSMGEDSDFFTDLVSVALPAYRDRVAAFAVRKYEWAADSDGNPQRKLSLWLESKLAPQTVTSESTHHSFVGGKRVWRGNFLRDNGIEIGGEMFRFGGHTQIELARKMRLELGRKFIAWKKTKGVLRRKGKKLTDGDGKPVKKSWYKCLSRTGGGTLKMPGLFRIRERQEYFGRLGADVRVRLFIRLSMTKIAGGGGMAGGMERKLTPARDNMAYLHVVKE